MKLIWYSAAPWNFTGYGNITREMLYRLRDAGHDVVCACKHNTGSWMEWEGFQVFQILTSSIMNKYIEYADADYVITLLDTWALKGQFKRWVAYYPSDQHIMSPYISLSLEPSVAQIAMSLDGKEQLENNKDYKYKPMYAPHGIETDIFKPYPEGRKAFRDAMKWTDDNFVIGSIGCNYPNDRKGFIPLIQAMSIFADKHPNARLYLHTKHVEATGNVPLSHIANSLGLGKIVSFAEQTAYELERIDKDMLCCIYNGMDVHCLATHGEGFGIPIVEAQACGTPSITTATTSGPELTKGGWLIEINPEYDLEYTPMKTWWARPSIPNILSALETAYKTWESGNMDAVKNAAYTGVQEYSWDNVWEKYWIPILNKLEEMKDEIREKEKEQRPDEIKGMAKIAPTAQPVPINLVPIMQ